MNSLFGFLLVAVFGGATENDDHQKIFNGVIISESYLASMEARTNKKFEPLKFYHWKDSIIDTTNYGHWDSVSHGIMIRRVSETMAREIFKEFISKIKVEGNYIYLTHRQLDSLKRPYFDIAIVQAKTQFDVVKRVGTHTLNYDISNEKVIEKLKAWDKRIQLEIVVADNDRIEAKIKNELTDNKKLAEEVSEFCPDVTENGNDSIEKLMNVYKTKHYLELWWN